MKKYRNKDEESLDKGLFQVDKHKKNKGKAYLNPDLLPLLFNYLKDYMTPLEKSCIYDYEFQNFLIEISLLRNKKGMQNNIFYLRDYIMYEIKHNPKYWITNSEMHLNINSEFPPPEEDVQKPENSKQNNESVEEYSRYLSRIGAIKENYHFFYDSYETNKELENIEQINKIPALQTDMANGSNPIEETRSEVEDNQGEQDEELSSENDRINLGEEEDEDYLLKPRLKFSNRSYLHYDSSYKMNSGRVTRQTRRKIREENPSLAGLNYKDYMQVMRKRRESEMNRRIIMYNVSSYKKYAKIEFQLFPFVYQFVLRNRTLDERSIFAVQNFIFYLFICDTPCKRKSRLRPDYLLREFSTEGSEELDLEKESGDFTLEEKQPEIQSTNNNEEGVDCERKCDGCESNKTFPSSEETVRNGSQAALNALYVPISSFPVKAYIYENQTMTSFNSYCLQEGIKLEALLASDAENGKKQRLLLINALDMLLEHVKYLPSKSQAVGDSPFIDRNSTDWQKVDEEKKEFLKQLLDFPENHKKCSEADIKLAVQYYMDFIEQLKFSSYHSETFYQYNKLTEVSRSNDAKKYRCEMEEEKFIGTTSDRAYIDTAIHSYIVLMNGEEMKQKRSYMFHNEERMEWTDEMYKRFLEGLQKFFEITINNKKIAKYIGGSVTSNHVKYVKGKYLRKLKKRAREMKIVPKVLLQEDINNFDINLFKNL